MTMSFDVVPQTLRNTTLGDLSRGDRVHMEAAATPTTLLGGHVMQGHIDGVGVVNEIVKNDGEWRIRITPPNELMSQIVQRGSIAIDGVSLTLAEVGDEDFTVALIPTTLEKTTLRELRIGSRVNLETDYIAKIVAHWLERREGGRMDIG